MFGRVSPWGLAACFLAVFGLLFASLVGIRSLTIALSALGVLAAVLGAALACRHRVAGEWVWLAIGGVLSAAVLSVTLFIPQLLNDYWTIHVAAASSNSDPNEQILVPRAQPRDPGRLLSNETWVDAATDAIRQDDLLIHVETVVAGRLPERSEPVYLLINFWVNQLRPESDINLQGFGSAQHRPVLTDDSGRSYSFVSHRPRRPFLTALDTSVVLDHLLIFQLPPTDAGSLKLEVPASAWGRKGVCRFRITSIADESNLSQTKLITHYKNMLRGTPSQTPDRLLGRAVFAKNCHECHTVFGFGGQVGPDLTDRKLPDGRLKRTDLDYLLTNIIDPSAEIDKDYKPSVVVTSNGQFIPGIIKSQSADTISLQTHAKVLIMPRKEIEEIADSKVSLMPNELLKPLSEHEVRSLIAYLSGPGQVPLLATVDSSYVFFNGQNLNYWHSAAPGWKVAKDEIVAPDPNDGVPALLISDLLLAEDFRLNLQFRPGKESGGAILIRGGEGLDFPATGWRIEFTAGRRLLVADEAEKAIQSDQKSGAGNIVQADSWNKLEVTVAGKRLQVRLNGKDEPPLTGAASNHRFIALEGPSVAGQQIYFRNLDVQLLAAKKSQLE